MILGIGLGFAALIALAGAGVATFAEYRRRQLLAQVRAGHWLAFNRAATMTAEMDTLTDRVEAEGEAPAGFAVTVGRAHAHAEDLVKDAVRQIAAFEPSFTDADFHRWCDEGKLDDGHMELFRKLAVDTKQRPLIAAARERNAVLAQATAALAQPRPPLPRSPRLRPARDDDGQTTAQQDAA